MSIPTSLIVVVLVLAWLVVLVPMVARRREAVPEAEMAGGTFRVLRRSGETSRRRPSLRRRPTDDGAENVADEQFSGDPDLDEELLDEEYDDTDEYDRDEYDSADDDRDGDELDEYGSAGYDEDRDDGERLSAADAPALTGSTATTSVDRRETSGSHPYQPAERTWSGSHPYRPARIAARSDAVPERYQPEPVPYQSEPARFEREAARYEDEAVGDDAYSSGGRPAPHHEEDLHLRPIPRRAGRGGYDPDAAELARQFKYRRRRRVAVVLLLAALLFSAAAVLINPVLWAGTAVFGLLLIGYLAYLRRQVQIEASIRERRLARLRRARQIRPEYDMHRPGGPATGSSFERSAMPASQAPTTGYRRGREIVDLDDDDPSFEDLEYYQPVTYRRASGQ